MGNVATITLRQAIT